MPTQERGLYQNLLHIALSEVEDLNLAKDLIANEVNSIQEGQNLTPFESSETQEGPVTRPNVEQPVRQSTPQMQASTPTSSETVPVVTGMITPIEERLLQKSNVLS